MLGFEYFKLLEELGDQFEVMGLLTGLCSIRFFSIMSVLAATSEQSLPGIVRNGLILWVGLFIAFGQPPQLLQDVNTVTLVLISFKEALIGVLLGFAMSTVFWAAESVGSLIDNIAGYNNVQQTNPSSSQQSTPVGQLLSQLAVAGFYMLGGLLTLVGILFESYQWWPLTDTTPPLKNMLERFVQAQVSQYMLAVAKIASPLLLILLLVDLAFGLLSKTAEKLEANNLAQPVKGAVALLMVSFLLVLFFQQLSPQLALMTILLELRQWFQHGPQ